MSTIKTNTLSNVAGTKTVPVDTVVSGSAKAWVNFNGTGTVAIRAAFNVSSITDNGTGDYTVNFTTAMPDSNYCWSSSAGYGTTSVIDGIITSLYGTVGTNQNSSSLRVITSDASAQTLYDAHYIGISIFR